MIYASVMLEKFPNNGQEYIKYMQTVRMAASRGVNGGWVQYDEQFRLRKARYPTSSWGVVDMELWLLCVATPKFSTVQRPFNTGLVNQHSQQLAVNNSLYNGGTGHNRGQSRNYLCRAFNMGKCTFGRNCKYLHKCSKCNGTHPLTACRS
jgi:hypothetical protein